MMAFSSAMKKILTVFLALIGIGTMWYYLLCTDSCAYLKGDIFGIDLKYIGIAFMLFAIATVLAGWSRLLRAALAAGIGGEIFLIGYQVYHGIFCPYCLTFAAALMTIFIVNYQPPMQHPGGWRRLLYLLGDVPVSVKSRTHVYPLSLCTAAGFLAFILAFSGSPAPLYAAEPPVPVIYGGGPVEVRIYADYFCKPCQVLEDDSEALLDRITAVKKARVVFVDVPGHRETALYARYFLYSTWNDPGYERAKTVRKLLFSAAKEKIATETDLIKYLQSRGVHPSLCPATEYFHALSRYIKEDRIHATPTCIIITKEGKRVYDTPRTIVKALQNQFRTQDGKS